MAGQTEDRCIVIAVTGGIAAFRACELVRNLKKKGYPVQVVMTENATRFVGTVTFAALTDRPVFTSSWGEGMEHIDLKNMAAVFAVVPATANIIGKMAGGIADDLVTSTYLALQCPVYIAPSMNPGMYSSKAVQRNLKTLAGDGINIIDPGDGEVVCGDVGRGKMAEVAKIESTLIAAFDGKGGDAALAAKPETKSASEAKPEPVVSPAESKSESPPPEPDRSGEIAFEIADEEEEDEIIVMQEETIVIDDEGHVREGW